MCRRDHRNEAATLWNSLPAVAPRTDTIGAISDNARHPAARAPRIWCMLRSTRHVWK
jgi:hypothetical protein